MKSIKRNILAVALLAIAPLAFATGGTTTVEQTAAYSNSGSVAGAAVGGSGFAFAVGTGSNRGSATATNPRDDASKVVSSNTSNGTGFGISSPGAGFVAGGGGAGLSGGTAIMSVVTTPSHHGH